MKKSFGVKRLSMNTINKYDEIANGNEEKAMFVGGEDLSNDFLMASGTVASRSTEPYVLNINNAGVGTETAIIFGRNRFVGQANFGSGANITITMGVTAVPYEQMLQQSASEPFEIVKIRLSSTSTTQLDQSMTIVVTDANGQEARTPLTISSYLSPEQFQDSLRDLDVRYQVDGNFHMEYPILAGQAVVMSVYIDAKVNISKPLVNRGAITEFSKARIRSFKS